MASNNPNPMPASAQPGFFESLAAKPEQVKIGLLVLIGVLICIPLVVGVPYRSWEACPQFAVLVTIGLLLGVVASALVYSFPNERSTLVGADRLRVLALAITAEVGASAALLGLGLPVTDR